MIPVPPGRLPAHCSCRRHRPVQQDQERATQTACLDDLELDAVDAAGFSPAGLHEIEIFHVAESVSAQAKYFEVAGCSDTTIRQHGSQKVGGEALFAFPRLPASQWKSAWTTNAIERRHEEFLRRIKTQTVLPSAETAAMQFWALSASGQISMRKVSGWQSLGQPSAESSIDLAA